MKSTPLVTVICLCYEQGRYVREALDSVVAQDYLFIELVVVDDFSSDESRDVIRAFAAECDRPCELVFPPENLGNCAAFNLGLAKAKGKYVIDLAGDDVMVKERVRLQVAIFESLPEVYGVVCSDAFMTDEWLRVRSRFYDQKEMLPNGRVYRYLVGQTALCGATMMIRKKVFDELGGYNEALSYEDYDFWVRSSYRYHYYFMPEALTYKRELKGSHGAGFYLKRANKHLASTLAVCRTAMGLNQTWEEDRSLAWTVRYYLKVSVMTENREVAKGFYRLLTELNMRRRLDDWLYWVNQLGLPVYWIYRLIRRV